MTDAFTWVPLWTFRVLTLILVGEVAILVLIVVCFVLSLRRLAWYHREVLQHQQDLLAQVVAHEHTARADLLSGHTARATVRVDPGRPLDAERRR